MQSVLLVDNDPVQRMMLAKVLNHLPDAPAVEVCTGAHELLAQMEATSMTGAQAPAHGLVIISLMQDVEQGLMLLRHCIKKWPCMLVVVIVPYHSTHLVEQALTLGACDYLSPPITTMRMVVSIRQWAHLATIQAESMSDALHTQHDLVGVSRQHVALLTDAKQAAQSGKDIMILGEPGVGKRRLAYSLHQQGMPSSKIMEHALAKGARHIGFPVAEAHVETYILRVACLKDVEYVHQHVRPYIKQYARRLVMCINTSASHGLIPSLSSDIAQNYSFLHITPLRERQEDVVVLAEAILLMFTKSGITTIKRLEDACASWLKSQYWQENVRELILCLLHATMCCHTPVLKVQDCQQALQKLLRHQGNDCSATLLDANGQLRTLEDVERDILRFAFRYYNGSRSMIARHLGIGRTTLYRKSQVFGIDETSA